MPVVARQPPLPPLPQPNTNPRSSPVPPARSDLDKPPFTFSSPPPPPPCKLHILSRLEHTGVGAGWPPPTATGVYPYSYSLLQPPPVHRPSQIPPYLEVPRAAGRGAAPRGGDMARRRRGHSLARIHGHTHIYIYIYSSAAPGARGPWVDRNIYIYTPTGPPR